MVSMTWKRTVLRLLHAPRPRLTWRYLVCFGIGVYVISCLLLAFRSVFSSRLPAYTGPYSVGTIDLEIPIKSPRMIHDARFKNNGHHAFEVCGNHPKSRKLVHTIRHERLTFPSYCSWRLCYSHSTIPQPKGSSHPNRIIYGFLGPWASWVQDTPGSRTSATL